MKLLYKLQDDQYPFTYIDHVRNIARGFILNEQSEVLLEYIYDDDGFGHRDYYETPGGGVKDNESLQETLIREIEEECGYLVQIIDELGEVDDYYNLIHRENHNYYFIAKVIGVGNKKQEPDEIKRIKDISFHPIDEAISLYENMQSELVGKLVKQRELPLLLMVKNYLYKKDKK